MDIHTHKILEAVQALSEAATSLLVEEQQLQARELERMSGLLHEAITELANCFSVMSDQLVTRSARIQHANEVNDDNTSGQEMNGCVTRAIVALQFEDILQQMIRHSCQRNVETRKLIHSLQARIESLGSGTMANQTAIMQMLDACHKEVDCVRTALDLTNPARQKNMKKGDITLF